MADRIVVSRLGRNNGEFDARTVTTEQLVAAIRALDNVSPTQDRHGAADSGDHEAGTR